MTLTRADFVGVMKNAISGLGLGPDAAMVTFPIELFLPGSDIAPVEARKREFYDGLTRWTSDLAGDAGGEVSMVSVQRGDVRGRPRQGEQPDARQPVGRRPAPVAGDARARGVDPAG